MIQKLFVAYYEWQMGRRKRLFERLLNEPTSGMARLLQNRSTEMAMHMVMRWLDNERIRHCTACPSTKTLRAIRDKFWCPMHYDEALKALKEQEQLSKAALAEDPKVLSVA